jgi:hypothetical protein
MIYNGTNVTETILFSPISNVDDVHCIDLIKADDESIFYVTTCCNDDWVWAFYMDGLSNYEMVKHTIMDTAFECVDMYQLLGELDSIFATDFEDIIAHEVDEERMCNDVCCCENCNHRGCLN